MDVAVEVVLLVAAQLDLVEVVGPVPVAAISPGNRASLNPKRRNANERKQSGRLWHSSARLLLPDTFYTLPLLHSPSQNSEREGSVRVFLTNFLFLMSYYTCFLLRFPFT